MYERKRCVLVADDEERILRALRDLLSANGYFVRTARTGRETLELAFRHRDEIDLLLLDVMMPEGDGFSVLQELRGSLPDLPVILLTARDQEPDQLQGFRCGADDYVAKPFSTTVLLARMEAVLRRAGPKAPEILTAGAVTMVPEQRKVEAGGCPLELTRREFGMLYCFLCNQGRVLSREQLLDSVWGYDYSGDEWTVDTHVKNLRLKLGPYAGYLQTAYGVGYKFEAAP